MGDFQVISTTDALSGSHACQHNSSSHEKCALFQKFMVLLESPCGYSLLTDVTSLNY